MKFELILILICTKYATSHYFCQCKLEGEYNEICCKLVRMCCKGSDTTEPLSIHLLPYNINLSELSNYHPKKIPSYTQEISHTESASDEYSTESNVKDAMSKNSNNIRNEVGEHLFTWDYKDI